MLDSLAAFEQHRQIDLVSESERQLAGARRRGPAAAGEGSAVDNDAQPAAKITVNIQGADLTTPSGARQVAERLVPHVSAVMQRVGRDAFGFNRLTAAGAAPYNGAPAAYPR
jgi:hypothetical protein